MIYELIWSSHLTFPAKCGMVVFIEDAVEGVIIMYIYVYVCNNLINTETSRPYYSSRVLVVVSMYIYSLYIVY